MIHVKCRRTVGEVLFPWCFARVLAERFKYYLEPVFAAPFQLHRKVNGERVLGPTFVWNGQWPAEAYSGRPITRSELHQEPGARLVLEGAFQRFELIAEYRETIRDNWLKIDSPPAKRSAGDFAICLFLAEGDAISDKREGYDALVRDGVLTVEEVQALMKTVANKCAYLFTDEPFDPRLDALRRLGAQVVHWRGVQEFLLLQSFQKIAISQNVTQWWAAFLSEAKEIYFPPCSRGLWSHPTPAELPKDPWHYGIDLSVRDERYIYDWA